MSDQPDRFQAQNNMVIDRETRKLEKKRATVEALKNTMGKSIAQAFKDERIKQAMAKDALYATERSKRGEIDPTLREVNDVGGGQYNSNNEVITGLEPPPWANDDSDPWE